MYLGWNTLVRHNTASSMLFYHIYDKKEVKVICTKRGMKIHLNSKQTIFVNEIDVSFVSININS